MTVSKTVRLLIAVHICLSLGGLILHARAHPVSQSLFFWWAAPTAAFSLVVLPILFYRTTTVGWAYVFNAVAVLVGTVGMTYFSILQADGFPTLKFILTESTLPDIVILWAKLPLAHAILVQARPHGATAGERGCRK